MASINIGSLKFNWKGNYNGSTAYAVDDVTEYNGSSYICILASTGNLPTNTTYFQPMATKGTDGTDVGTTITTQGDILYRDGSGLQRLAKPASTMYLQMTSGGVPSWSAVSSDYVKLASGTFSTSSDNLILDGFTSSDYKSYVLRMQSASTNNSGNSLRLRFRQSGTDQNTEYLRIGNYNGITTSNSSTGSFNNISNYNQDHYPFGHHGSTNEDINYAELVFNELTSTDKYKIIFSRSLGRDGSSQWTFWNMAGMWRPNQNAVTGIKIYTGSGNFTITGNYEMYGIKG